MVSRIEPLFNDNVFPNERPATSFVGEIMAASAHHIGNAFKGSTTKPLIGDGAVP
jgi:hypothetical protein